MACISKGDEGTIDLCSVISLPCPDILLLCCFDVVYQVQSSVVEQIGKSDNLRFDDVDDIPREPRCGILTFAIWHPHA